jgi:hypothetical protein
VEAAYVVEKAVEFVEPLHQPARLGNYFCFYNPRYGSPFDPLEPCPAAALDAVYFLLGKWQYRNYSSGTATCPVRYLGTDDLVDPSF